MNIPVLKGTSGVNTPLVDFNMIFDLDYSILVVIYKYYFDTSIFNESFFNNIHTVRDLVKLCINREDVNPLYMTSDIDKDTLDDLYNQFLTDSESLEKIEEYIMVTKFYQLIKMFNSSGDIDTTILYHNDFQKKLLDKYRVTKSTKKVRSDKVDYTKYNQFYLKYGCITDKYNISNPLAQLSDYAEENTIYLADYPFNKITSRTDKDMFEILSASINEYTDKLVDRGNLFRFISTYDMRDVYYDEYIKMTEGDEDEEYDES